MDGNPIPSPKITADDPMAAPPDTVFRNRELLRPQYVPDGDRIVGRDQQIKTLEQLLRPATNGNPPESGFLFGESGTGKSLAAKHVTGRAQAIAQMHDCGLVTVYIDCDQYDTETRVARELALQVRSRTGHTADDIHIPESGIGASEYYDFIWGRHGLLESADSLVVIIDEIDLLGDNAASVLSKLSRSEETGKTDCYIAVLAISNKTDYTQANDKRVASSFQDEPIVFPPYEAQQLSAILNRRRDAFCDDVLEEGALRLAAAKAAQDYGDARQALDLVRTAGKLADKASDSTVTDSHVERADEYVDLNRSLEVVANSTKHSRYTLYALAYLIETQSQIEFSTGRVYDVYRIVSHAVGGDPRTHQRILELLKEWTQPDITEHHHTGHGQGKGSSRVHRLLHEPDIIREAAIPDQRDRDSVEEALDAAGL